MKKKWPREKKNVPYLNNFKGKMEYATITKDKLF